MQIDPEAKAFFYSYFVANLHLMSLEENHERSLKLLVDDNNFWKKDSNQKLQAGWNLRYE